MLCYGEAEWNSMHGTMTTKADSSNWKIRFHFLPHYSLRIHERKNNTRSGNSNQIICFVINPIRREVEKKYLYAISIWTLSDENFPNSSRYDHFSTFYIEQSTENGMFVCLRRGAEMRGAALCWSDLSISSYTFNLCIYLQRKCERTNKINTRKA